MTDYEVTTHKLRLKLPLRLRLRLWVRRRWDRLRWRLKGIDPDEMEAILRDFNRDVERRVLFGEP